MQQVPIQLQDVQQIEVLALVLVQSLDLHIKEGIGADADAAQVLDGV